jgi:hypothetical protein
MWKTLSVEDPHEGHAPRPRLAAMPIGTNAAKSETGTKDCLEDVQAVDDHELPEEQQDEHDQRGDRHLELIRPRVHAQERRPHLWRRDVARGVRPRGTSVCLLTDLAFRVTGASGVGRVVAIGHLSSRPLAGGGTPRGHVKLTPSVLKLGQIRIDGLATCNPIRGTQRLPGHGNADHPSGPWPSVTWL